MMKHILYSTKRNPLIKYNKEIFENSFTYKNIKKIFIRKKQAIGEGKVPKKYNTSKKN